jgi:hypothetical protein
MVVLKLEALQKILHFSGLSVALLRQVGQCLLILAIDCCLSAWGNGLLRSHLGCRIDLRKQRQEGNFYLISDCRSVATTIPIESIVKGGAVERRGLRSHHRLSFHLPVIG